MPKQPDPAETSAHPDDDQPVQPRASRLKRLLLLLLGIIVVLTALMLSTAPAVPPASAPNAADVTAASDALKDLTDKDTRRGQQIALTLDRQQLAGITALASQALSPARVTATLGPDKDAPESTAALTAHYSRPLLLGLWVNVRAEVHGMQDGVPDVTVRVGRLPLPRWLSRMAMQTAWGWAQDDAPDQVPLDEAIRSISVTPDAIRVVLVSPGRGAALAGLSRITGNTADGAAVATLYCALAVTDTSDFAVLVRRAFAMPVTQGTSPVEHNRSTLIAIAMVAVPPYRERLAGTALPAIRACPATGAQPTLAGRHDLAMHWALSAALAATLGGQVARSMGEWKELADSTGDGSGFSFVDLAADRSGERFAAAAIKPSLARPVQRRLGAVTDAQLMPRALLTKPEGLDQQAFERAYQAIDAPEYQRALATIDRILNEAGVPSL